MINKIKTYILSHKIITIVAIVIIAVSAYFIFKNSASGETRYITENVKKGDIITTVSGTGQVEASNTIDIKPKTTGDITYVGVKVGDIVKKGKLIASVDSRDAKIALENAQISLAKLTKDPDALTLLQKENSLDESYDNGWNSVSSFVTDMTLIISDLKGLYSSDGYLGYKNISSLSSSGKTKVNLAESSYYDAKKSIDDISKLYKSLTRSSSQDEINELIKKSYESSKIIANAVKNTETAFNYVVEDLEYENNSDTASNRTNITSWISSANNYVNNLLSSINGIKEGEQSLKDTVAGSDELDIRSAELSLQSKQYAYNDCFIYASFDGVIATLTAKVGESSGSSVGTLITKQKIVTIPFNEVDVTSIKLEQKVTITFDAIEGLSVSGVVAEIDPVGTVSSGVVTYNVKIAFDSDDDRIKPGMSANTEIITQEKKDILTVTSSAIKTKNKKVYVEVFEVPLPSMGNINGITSAVPPVRKEVTIGLSDDLKTEIISGLNEGDQIVLKTTTSSKTSSTTSTPSILNSVGATRGMGAGGGTPPRN
ncbi:MAG: HlyD family efflux transporter periplasmic adaptor subunit [Candidatus Paceibacterota bacterium]